MTVEIVIRDAWDDVVEEEIIDCPLPDSASADLLSKIICVVRS